MSEYMSYAAIGINSVRSLGFCGRKHMESFTSKMKENAAGVQVQVHTYAHTYLCVIYVHIYMLPPPPWTYQFPLFCWCVFGRCPNFVGVCVWHVSEPDAPGREMTWEFKEFKEFKEA